VGPAWAFLAAVAAVAMLCFREYAELTSLHAIESRACSAMLRACYSYFCQERFCFSGFSCNSGDGFVVAVARTGGKRCGGRQLLLGVVYVFGSLRCGIACTESARIGYSSRYRSIGQVTSRVVRWTFDWAPQDGAARESRQIVGRRRGLRSRRPSFMVPVFPRCLHPWPLLKAWAWSSGYIGGQSGTCANPA